MAIKDSINKVNDFLIAKNIDAKKFRLILYYSAFLIVFELLAYVIKGPFSIIASRVWGIGWAICVVSILVLFVRAFIDEIKAKNTLFILSFILISLFLGHVFFGQERYINQDAPQHIAAGLSSFEASDWSYTGQSVLNYQNRQYVLAAIPAVFLGRTVFAMQLGFAYPLFLGLMLFFVAMRNWAKNKGIHTGFAAVSVSLLFAFPYLVEYYKFYLEQSILPLSFTLIAIGWLLLLINKTNLLNFFGLMWICTMMTNTYTPALSGLALFIVLFFVLALASKFDIKIFKMDRKYIKDAKKSYFYRVVPIISVTSIFFVLFTYMFGRGDRLTQLSGGSISESFSRSIDAYKLYFLSQPAVFTGVLVVFIIAFMIISLTFRAGATNFIITGWILGVVGLSTFLKGYSVYEPRVCMSRCLITIPVTVAAISLIVYHLIKEKKWNVKPFLLMPIVILSMSYAFYNAMKPTIQGDSSVYMMSSCLGPLKHLSIDLESSATKNNISHESESLVVLYTNSSWLQSISLVNKFAYPNAKTFFLKSGESLPAEALDILNKNKGATIYYEENMQLDPALNNIGKRENLEFKFDDGGVYKATRISVAAS